MIEEDEAPTLGVPPFEMGPTTRSLISYFSKSKPGDLLEYEEIDKAVGCSHDTWQGRMTVIRKHLLENYSIALECEPGVGYRHVADNAISTVSGKSVIRAFRNLKRGHRLHTKGIKDPSALTSAEQTSYFTRGAMLSTLLYIAAPKSERVVEKLTKAVNCQLDVGTTLDVLRKKM